MSEKIRIFDILTSEVKPNVSRSVWDVFEKQRLKGLERYGKEIDIDDGHQWDVEILEELCDAVNYVTAWAAKNDTEEVNKIAGYLLGVLLHSMILVDSTANKTKILGV